jgi:transcriptional regulator with XRE-family HTH domain
MNPNTNTQEINSPPMMTKNKNKNGKPTTPTTKNAAEELRKDMGDRIKVVRLAQSMTLEQWGAIFGMSKIWAHAVENGRHEINLAVIRTIKRRFGVSYEYLIDGVGDMTTVSETARLMKECEGYKDKVTILEREKSNLMDYIDHLKK